MGLVMPFGKYAGTPLGQVPVDYCAWAVGNLKHLDADLQAALRKEMADRQVEFMYYARAPFRAALLPVGTLKPEVAWVRFLARNGVMSKEAVPAYPLTPAVYARLFWAKRRTEDLVLRKRATTQDLATQEAVLGPISAYVGLWLPLADVKEAVCVRGDDLATTQESAAHLPDGPNPAPPENSTIYVVKWSVKYGYRCLTDENGAERPARPLRNPRPARPA